MDLYVLIFKGIWGKIVQGTKYIHMVPFVKIKKGHIYKYTQFISPYAYIHIKIVSGRTYKDVLAVFISGQGDSGSTMGEGIMSCNLTLFIFSFFKCIKLYV